jgi:uncharacterized oligopeptide transporter (OPT) family protein
MADAEERRWLAEVYRPADPQLTVRAVVTGMILGAVMCCSNMYIVLKTGWSFGVTVTACIIAYGFWAALRAGGAREFGMLENNTMGSVASAAGYMTGGGNMAAIPALFMLTGVRPDTVPLIAWFAVIATLGVFTAIPIKRQLINQEQLAFPTGTATGATLRTLHSHGGEGRKKARLLAWSALIGVAITVLRDVKAGWMLFNIPATISLPFTILGEAARKWTLALEGSLLLVGAGALVSFKTGWSMLLGSLVTYGVLAPMMVEQGVIATISYKAIVQWSRSAFSGEASSAPSPRSGACSARSASPSTIRWSRSSARRRGFRWPTSCSGRSWCSSCGTSSPFRSGWRSCRCRWRC